MINGADCMVQSLVAEGVTLLFGYPGAAICPFYDKLYTAGIHHVLVRSEQNAAHAASGYARAGGGVGVCAVTSGPGATNLITGIAAAYMDSIPLVAITGQVPLGDLGKDVFQEADVTGACESFVKHSYLVKRAADLPRIFREAFHIAKTGRPGPVLIDVPQDVQEALVPHFSYPERVEVLGYKPTTRGHSLQIKKALEAITQARRPLLCCGGGVALAGAEDSFRAFGKQSGIPVIATMMGLGVFSAGSKDYLGMVGSFGMTGANRALHEADLLILCGARVADRAIAHPGNIRAQVIHIDIDPAEIGKNLRADIPIVGDLRQVLPILCENTPHKPSWFPSHPPITLPPDQEDYVNPSRFVRDLSAQMQPEDTLLADAGQSLIWAADNFTAGHFLTSGGLGAMGYALPAALGVRLARPKNQAIALLGDGAFQMSQCELATAVGIPIKIVLFDNGRLGMVRELQNHQYGGRHMATHLGGNPDFVKLAQAYGIRATYAANNQAARACIPALLAHKGSYVLVCRVDPETPSLEGGLL